MTLSDISIRRFDNALHKKDYNGIDNWQELWLSYLDQSGIGETREKSLITAQYILQSRLLFIYGIPDEDIPGYLKFQEMFFIAMDQPCTGVFSDLHKYGHRLTWDASNPSHFLQQLKKIDAKERRNKAELDKIVKELSDYRKGQPIVKENEDSRRDFTRRYYAVSKEFAPGLDRDKTMMDDYCILLKDYDQMIADFNNKNK